MWKKNQKEVDVLWEVKMDFGEPTSKKPFNAAFCFFFLTYQITIRFLSHLPDDYQACRALLFSNTQNLVIVLFVSSFVLLILKVRTFPHLVSLLSSDYIFIFQKIIDKEWKQDRESI